MHVPQNADRRGVSPIVATVFLILATVIVGGTIFYLSRTHVATLSSNAAIEVQSIDLLTTTSGSQFSVTLKNTGTTSVDNVVVSLSGLEEPQSWSSDNFEGGTHENTAAGSLKLGTWTSTRNGKRMMVTGENLPDDSGKLDFHITAEDLGVLDHHDLVYLYFLAEDGGGTEAKIEVNAEDIGLDEKNDSWTSYTGSFGTEFQARINEDEDLEVKWSTGRPSTEENFESETVGSSPNNWTVIQGTPLSVDDSWSSDGSKSLLVTNFVSDREDVNIDYQDDYSIGVMTADVKVDGTATVFVHQEGEERSGPVELTNETATISSGSYVADFGEEKIGSYQLNEPVAPVIFNDENAILESTGDPCSMSVDEGEDKFVKSSATFVGVEEDTIVQLRGNAGDILESATLASGEEKTLVYSGSKFDYPEVVVIEGKAAVTDWTLTGAEGILSYDSGLAIRNVSSGTKVWIDNVHFEEAGYTPGWVDYAEMQFELEEQGISCNFSDFASVLIGDTGMDANEFEDNPSSLGFDITVGEHDYYELSRTGLGSSTGKLPHSNVRGYFSRDVDLTGVDQMKLDFEFIRGFEGGVIYEVKIDDGVVEGDELGAPGTREITIDTSGYSGTHTITAVLDSNTNGLDSTIDKARFSNLRLDGIKIPSSGRWTSPWIDLGGHVSSFSTLSTSTSIPSGAGVSVRVQSSDDANAVKDETSPESLTDGSNTVGLSDLSTGRYARVIYELTAGSSPTVESYELNTSSGSTPVALGSIEPGNTASRSTTLAGDIPSGVKKVVKITAYGSGGSPVLKKAVTVTTRS